MKTMKFAKRIWLLSILSVGVLVASAEAGQLDGKTFCRTVDSDGSLGQPAGQHQHCVTFANDTMADNADTFFGNPPETVPYRMQGKKVLARSEGTWKQAYEISRNGRSLQNDVGAVLALQQSSVGESSELVLACRDSGVRINMVKTRPNHYLITFKSGNIFSGFKESVVPATQSPSEHEPIGPDTVLGSVTYKGTGDEGEYVELVQGLHPGRPRVEYKFSHGDARIHRGLAVCR